MLVKGDDSCWRGMIFLLLLLHLGNVVPYENKCADTCKIRIVETIPYNVTFPGSHLSQSTVSAWLDLIGRAQKSINLAEYKNSLLAGRVLKGAELETYGKEGNAIFNLLTQKSKNVTIRLVDKSEGANADHNLDASILDKGEVVIRRPLDVERALGKGINHIKLMVVDGVHFYLGSANMDWRSLNQKMELGVLVTDCPCLGEDANRIFESLWGFAIGKNTTAEMPAKYTASNPLKLYLGSGTETFLSAAPVEMNNLGRTHDIDALVSVIRSAKVFLYMHVMDYFPLYLYQSDKSYWAQLDNAIRDAVLRGVTVRMLGSPIHFESVGIRFLKSLQDLNGMRSKRTTNIIVKVFVVPPVNASWEINDNRRTHNKFIVTENQIAIGTSNWAADYFSGTTGASIIVKQYGTSKPLIDELDYIFKRDFYSPYAHLVDDYYNNCILKRTAVYCQLNKNSDGERLTKILSGTFYAEDKEAANSSSTRSKTSFFFFTFICIVIQVLRH